jgi:hypothetical protein
LVSSRSTPKSCMPSIYFEYVGVQELLHPQARAPRTQPPLSRPRLEGKGREVGRASGHCRGSSLAVELRPPIPTPPWSPSRWSRGRPEEGEATTGSPPPPRPPPQRPAKRREPACSLSPKGRQEVAPRLAVAMELPPRALRRRPLASTAGGVLEARHGCGPRGGRRPIRQRPCPPPRVAGEEAGEGAEESSRAEQVRPPPSSSRRSSVSREQTRSLPAHPRNRLHHDWACLRRIQSQGAGGHGGRPRLLHLRHTTEASLGR